MIRGGAKYKSIIGLNACGASGFAVLFTHLVVSIIVSVINAKRIISETTGLTAEQTRKYSIQITQKNVWYFLFAGFLAGFLAGLMAIGASLILVPVWLKFGVDKDYAGNSTATLILMASIVTFTVAYFNNIFEEIPTYMLVFYLALSFVSSVVVKSKYIINIDILALITKKYKL